MEKKFFLNISGEEVLYRINRTECNKIVVNCPIGHEVEIIYPHAPEGFPQAFPCSCGAWKSVWPQFQYGHPECPYCREVPRIEASLL
jgi:hypothetical protein